MSQQKIEVVGESRKPVEQMFAALADHNQLGRVLGIPVRRVRDGRDDINGVGSVRRLGLGPLGVEETVTLLEPNRRIEYRISKGGGPVRNHRGKLEFSGSHKGSRVTWTIQFDSPLPLFGPLLKLVLSQGIRLGLKRIA